MRIILFSFLGFVYLKYNSILMNILAILFICTALYLFIKFTNQIYINKKFLNENIISFNNYSKFLSF
jgi:hypothetical protein